MENDFNEDQIDSGEEKKHKCCGGKCKSQGAAPADLEPEQSTPLSPEELMDQEIMQIKVQAADYKDKYLRGLAESENVRKRMQKERQELVQYAIQNVILDFLTPIDHFENALKFTQQAAPEVQHWAVGFQMILNQFKDVLAANGVTPLESVGRPFDHNWHEAIEMVATADYPPGTVVEECVRGYKMGDRVLRPARVKVAKSIEVAVEEENDEQQQ